MPELSAPRGVSDIDCQWLTEALAPYADGAVVTEVTTTRIGQGNVADSVRLVPTWDRPTPAPHSLVAKVPSSDPVSRATGFAVRTYELEAAFYATLARTVWVHRPDCYLSMYDPANEGYVVLLEDLAPAEAGDQVLGCAPADAYAVMPELAALHAPRWDDPALMEVPWLDHPTKEGAAAVAGLVTALFPGFVDRYRERLPADVLAIAERLVGSLEPYLANRPRPWTLVHCDFRLDNLLFGGPRVAVVDWQTVKAGPALSDVAYFIGSALHVAERREHEVPLLRSYQASLAAAGVNLDWAECLEGYRRYCFDGLLMAIIASMLVGRSERGDDMFMAMAVRHGQQAIDLGAASEFLR
jgi:hypothetical protein